MTLQDLALFPILCTFALGAGACAEDDDIGDDDVDAVGDVEELTVQTDAPEPMLTDGSVRDIPGVGRIQYAESMHDVATIALREGGEIHFHELDEDRGYGCTAFFPGDVAGDPALDNAGKEGCLSTYLALAPRDAPIPAVLLAEADDDLDVGDREIVEAVSETIVAAGPYFSAQARPAAGQHDHYNHSCGAGNHWVAEHCDEGGADHCDPGPQTSIFITSGHTYRSSYQTGLYCGNGAANAEHYWWNGSGWAPIYGWSHSAGSPSNNYISWSLHQGNIATKRAISSGMGGTGEFRHYTKMCPGLVCATGG